MCVADTVAATHFKGNKSQKDQMDRQQRAETVNNSKLDTDMQDTVNNGAQQVRIRPEILKALAKFQNFWDGRLAESTSRNPTSNWSPQILNPSTLRGTALDR